MAASHRQFNTRNVSFTPVSGTATIYTGITTTGITGGGTTKMFSGDGDLFPTTRVKDFADPGFSFTSADVINAVGAGQGSTGSATMTYKDAKNQTPAAGTGDISFVLSPAIIENIDFSGPYRDFASGNVKIVSYSTDGYTSPVSYLIQT